MIFETQTQFTCLIICVFFGFIVGIIYLLYNLFFTINFKKSSVKTIFFSVFYMFFAIFFIILINFFNYGKFSIVLSCGYIGGFIWAKNIFSNSVVYLEKKWYNVLTSGDNV